VLTGDCPLRYHVLRKSASERFEDGTLPFTSIVALKFGLDTLLEGPAPGGTEQRT
jgi:hypothetical protein